jgi:hypothetical protein
MPHVNAIAESAENSAATTNVSPTLKLIDADSGITWTGHRPSWFDDRDDSSGEGDVSGRSISQIHLLDSLVVRLG